MVKGSEWTLRASLRRRSAQRGSITDKLKRLSQVTAFALKSAPAGKELDTTEEGVQVKQTVVHTEGRGGKKGLQAVQVIDEESGARVTVTIFGGDLVSFRGSDGKERLFLSKKACADKSKAVRGGVPIVFPQFGNAGPLASHGFARNQSWEFCTGDLRPRRVGGMIHLALRLCDTKATRKMWNHKFELIHHIRFGASELETSLSITNLGKKAFPFQALLHTYLRMRNVCACEIEGLEGLRLVDKLQYHEYYSNQLIMTQPTLKVNSATDDVFMNAGRQPIMVVSEKDNTVCEINVAVCQGEKVRECDVVVWNPGEDKARRMDDLEDDEFQNMLCIEPGCASRVESCKSGETWTVTQNLRFSKINVYGVRK